MGITKETDRRLEELYQKHLLDVIRWRDKGFTEEDICKMLNLNPKIYKIVVQHTPIC